MTMSEALDYINSNGSPDLTAESITPTGVATQTPRPIPTPICVAGFDPNCLAEPSLVPSSDDQWAYYVSNGIYFEYPSTWHIEQQVGSHLYIMPVSDSPEASSTVGVILWTTHLPIEIVEQKDILTLCQAATGSYKTPIWERPVSLPDFEGVEFLWREINAYAGLEVFLYAENDNIAVDLKLMGIDDQMPELIDNPNAVTEIYPEFQHIVKSFRIWNP